MHSLTEKDEHMRVAVYYSNSDVRVEERPVPKIGPGEILLKVMASGICGSDVLEWYRLKRAPLILGHEVAGEIVDTGEGVEGWKKGDRVVAAHHVPCNTCYYCRRGHPTACDTLRSTNFDPGGFAEYVRLPAINVDRGIFSLPDEVSYAEGSLTEPLACVLRAQRICGVRPGDSVLVLGSGISGLLHIDYAQAVGAGRIMATDIAPYRMEAAKKFGAEVVLHAGDDIPARVREVNDGRLADRVLVCTGNAKANQQALACVERGGTVLYFAFVDPGVTVSLDVGSVMLRNDITLTTSYAGSPADCAEAIELIRAGRVRAEDMITHRLSLEEATRGFELVAGAGDSIKVVLEPHR